MGILGAYLLSPIIFKNCGLEKSFGLVVKGLGIPYFKMSLQT
jgi:hypothetical protein